nr:retrotransposon protein, putative, Ty1-copia subclass [Tanacetum cinerariifolium]
MNINNSSTGTTFIIDKIEKFEELITSGKATLVDAADNPLKKVKFPDNYDSEDEVASVDNDMARSMAFKRNYNMHSMGNTIVELHAMIKLVEKGIPKKAFAPAILAIKDNVIYFNVISWDGIYEIDMHNMVSNDSFVYFISNKRAKRKLDSTFLWDCRIGHINKNRIAKMQHDGILQSINDESFDTCVSCLSGKMARQPFTYKTKRAKDLLGLINTDICGPFITTSREGDNYYVSFTDDFSRCRYVYLIRHKHQGYALQSSPHILNMVSIKKVEKTLYELWHGKVLNLSYLKVWVTLLKIQREDMRPKNISDRLTEDEHKSVIPHDDKTLARRSTRISSAPLRFSFNIDVSEED